MKARFILLMCLFALTTINGRAYDFYFENEDGDVLYLNDVTQFEFQPEVEVVGGYVSNDGELSIPATYGKYKIAGIGAYAFQNNSSIKTLIVEDGLKYIGQNAFERCTSLDNVQLSKSLFEISSEAFKLCIGLKEIRLTASLISHNALDYCTNLGKIIFSPNVSEVASWAFTNCNNIKTLIFEDGAGEVFLGYGGNNYEMNYGLFHGLKLDYVYLGRGINYKATSEKHMPFYDTGIESPLLGPNACTIPPYWYKGYVADELIIPDAVTHIANNAFEQSSIGRVVLNKNLKKIGDYAFHRCNAEIIQHDNSEITSIGKYAFKSSGLKGIRLAEGITEIPEYVFEGCSKLESINIPNSVTRICNYAFANCLNLKITDSDLPQGVDSLGVAAFRNTAIESLTIPQGVRTVQHYLFDGCRFLKNIVLHEKINVIGDYSFRNCPLLQYVQLPQNVTKICNGSFQGSGLKNINVPSSVSSIGEYAFDGCVNLVNVTLPEKLEFLERYAFRNCGFTSFSFPKKVKYLRSEVIVDCQSLETVQLPTQAWDNLNNNYVSINHMFTGCKSLKEIHIPACVLFINGGFEGCNSLKKIHIEDSERIFLDNKDYNGKDLSTPLFADCPLDSVYIGCNVLLQNNPKIDSYSNTAFYGKKIKSVELGGRMTEIPSFLFPNCEINKAYVSENIKKIKVNAFIETMPDTVTCASSNPANMELNALKGALVSVPLNSGVNYRSYDSWNQNLIVDAADTITTVKVRYPGAIIASFKQSGVMEPQNVTKIKIEGKINDSDWLVLKNDLPHIYYMDLSAAIIDSIPSFQFYNDCKINEIYLPTSIRKIGDNAFYGCNNLRLSKLTLESCEHVGKNAFFNASIEKIIFKKSIIIGDNAFSNSRVSSIDFNESANIGHNSFDNCKLLTEITFKRPSSIGAGAFRKCTGLTHVRLPELSKTLGKEAFRDCSNLTQVEFPEKGFVIGEYAFYNCENLASLNLNGNGYKIAPYAFANTGIKSLSLNNNIDYIGAYAFSNCANLLGHITLPQSLKSVEEGVFKECALFDGISLGDSVTKIGTEAFSGCINLVDINLPESLKQIAPNVFYGCKNISELDIPFGLVNFNGAFNNCNINKLRTHWQIPIPIDSTTFDGFDEDKCILTVPANSAMYYLTTDVWKIFWNIEEDPNEIIQNIQFKDPVVKALCVANWDITEDGELGADEALRVENLGNIFANNTGVESFDELIKFSRLNRIDASTFAGCTNLQSVAIPESVINIDSLSFETCPNLSRITIDNDNPIYDSRDNCNAIIFSETNTLMRGCNTSTVPNSVTHIGGYAFSGSEGLSRLVLPNNVASIGDYAFNGCKGLKHFEFSDSISTPPNNLFVGCDSLKYLYIGKNMTSISKDLLKHCRNVDTLYFNNEEVIAYKQKYVNGKWEYDYIAKTFGTRFKHVKLGENIKTIPYSSFIDCKGLETIDISESCDSIGSKAFENCTNLKKFSIPINANLINYNTFTNCSSLKGIVIPNGINSIDGGAFSGCASLDTIILSNISKLGSGVFKDCSSLKSVVISGNIRSLPSSTFKNCAKLTSVTLPKSIESIDLDAFDHCSSLDTLYLDCSLKNIASSAFYFASINYLYVPCCNVEKFAFSDCTIKEMTIERNVLTGCDTINFNGGIVNPISLNINCNFKGANFGQLPTFRDNNITKTISIGSGSQEDFKISIPASAFKGCITLKDLYLGQNVIDIGDQAFMNCTSLDTLILPSSLTTIQDSVFMNCKSLRLIDMPNSITNIGKSAFRSCGTHKSLYLSRSLESIEDYAFNGTNISFLNIPCCSIGMYAFVECNISDLRIEKNPVTDCDYIPNFHSDSDKLISLSINNCNLPGDGKFWYEDRLNSVYIGTDPGVDSPTITLPENAFSSCYNLKNVHLGSNVTIIGDKAFSSCRSLKTVTLSEGLTKIGMGAFGNTALDTIRIPSTVTEMSPIHSIKNVYVQWKEPIYVDGNAYNASTLYVPGGTSEKYKSAPYWKTFGRIVEYFTLGDVNNDDVVNITDAIGIVNHILQKTPSVFTHGAADINGDNTINITDAIGVINKILDVRSSKKQNNLREERIIEAQ